MRNALPATVGVAALILLMSGCAGPTSDLAESVPPTLAAIPPSTPTAIPSPTPTIDVGPVELSTEEAGQRYLGIVCQRNVAGTGLNEAFAAQEDTFLNGGEADATAVKAAAAEALRVGRLSVELLDDSYYMWPAEIQDDLIAIRDAQIAEAATLSAIVNAGRFEDAYYATWPIDPRPGAAQEIRYQLGLSADTAASCQGFETATDSLHAEMTNRLEYLAGFETAED
ncbi:hypothetical protein [Microbacterium sp. Marseille-Q6648]|uniref:hypothetical protein n=1 Tax=Microbacterium sp. Marseille-Q6648 TaxID=2937991 RepID=UPI002040DB8C|nr:hypothetical protein [Microbacterium sp. Marseille-Q6648]